MVKTTSALLLKPDLVRLKGGFGQCQVDAGTHPGATGGKAELCQPEVTLTPRLPDASPDHKGFVCQRIRMSNQSKTELAGGRKGHVEVTSWESVPSAKVNHS